MQLRGRLVQDTMPPNFGEVTVKSMTKQGSLQQQFLRPLKQMHWAPVAPLFPEANHSINLINLQRRSYAYQQRVEKSEPVAQKVSYW
jgi:hypothetical protein